MPLYEIPRSIPEVANWDKEARAKVAGASNAVVAEKFEPGTYTWKVSVVRTGDPDTLVCYHWAESVDAVVQHAVAGGFPIDFEAIKEVAEPDLSNALWTMGPGNALASDKAAA